MELENLPQDEPGKCQHCWHRMRRPFMAVLKDGHVAQECCKCGDTRQVHADHAYN